MANFEPPSFSLGLDFDLDSQPQQEPIITNLALNGNGESAERSSGGATRRRIQEDHDEDDDFETPSTVLDPQVPEPRRSLKRLRRGPTSEPTLVARKVEPKRKCLDVDDEIEEFSEEEQPLDNPLEHQYSLHSSSKLPLHGHGVLESQSAKELRGSKKKEVENASASVDTKAASNKLVFPKLTVSPLRKFQLIDSDSDDCLGNSLNNIVNQVNLPLNDRNCNLSQVTAATDLKKAKGSVNLPQNEDLWKEICSEKNFRVPTPALDEVCEEYFGSLKDRGKFQNRLEGCHEMSNSDRRNGQQCSLSPLPPAHHYYFHEDPRIQELVRARLSNFFPLVSGSNQGNRQQNACTIDYMSQFNHGEASKPAKQKELKNTMPSTSRGRKNVRNSKVQELSQGSESWVNPRNSSGIPKDAGKRRIQAAGKSAGHWYTASDGRRVYVGRNGQEMTGQIAYRQYRRESGAGFKRSRKKVSSKKKAAAKKK